MTSLVFRGLHKSEARSEQVLLVRLRGGFGHMYCVYYAYILMYILYVHVHIHYVQIYIVLGGTYKSYALHSAFEQQCNLLHCPPRTAAVPADERQNFVVPKFENTRHQVITKSPQSLTMPRLFHLLNWILSP